MKFVKKLTALFLAVCMVMAMGITAFAGDTDHTITGPGNGHTYKVYQIFTGDYDATSGKLSNIKWGAHGTGTVGEAVPEATLQKIQKIDGDDAAKATEIAANADTTKSTDWTLSDNNRTVSVPDGYYIIVDQKTVGEGETAPISVVKVVGNNVKVVPKTGDTPEFEKKVQDTNDSIKDSTSDWQDSADYDIGDAVPFKLTAKIAGDFASYTKYWMTISDQMEPSLTFDERSVVVKIGDTTLTKDTDYTIETGTTSSLEGSNASFNGGENFTITFANLTAVEAAGAGKSIEVTYNATLNERAVLGSTGNVNRAKLKYANKPDSNNGGEGEETPWDNVIVFTYQVVVNKYADKGSSENGQKLAGAEFTLKKKLANGETKDITTIKSEDGTTFTFKGLDDGDYVLSETTTPAGYNTIADIAFTVTAEHTIKWEDKTRDTILTSLTGTVTSGEITFTPSDDKSELSTEVINKSGSILPETGGMGTTVIYIAGIALIVAAGVVVIARKRMAR